MRKKSGFVSIIGAPNAGKSTLLNSLIGMNLSIVTSKPQTTRNRIFGILSDIDSQIIFVDTPGSLKPKYGLQKYMAGEIIESFEEADAIILIHDAQKDDRQMFKTIIDRYRKLLVDKRTILVLNKIDSMPKEHILLKISELSNLFSFEEIVPVSAKRNFNIDELKKVILKFIPEGEFYYDEDIITSQPEKFFVSEIIRQNAFRLLRDEIPFSVYVMINEFKEREKGKNYINASILVERESQKKILIGMDGKMIKTIGEKSRKRIEELLGSEVYLELQVRVSENWKNDETFLKKNIHHISRPISTS